MKMARCFGIFVLATTIISVENYELKHIACHDVTEEAIDLHSTWFAAPSGRCFDKHGMEYQQNDTIRSCCGCLTFQCVRNFELTTHRTEYFWSATSESDVDKRCCLSWEGKVFPEGTEMRVSSNEGGNCTTEVTTTCLYNPATRKGEITEDYSLKDCCLDSEGLHQISTEVMEPATCSVRKCKGISDHIGHSCPFWVSTRTFQDSKCCHLDGTMIPPGGWILSKKTLNLTCCEGKLVVESAQAVIAPAPTASAPTTPTPNAPAPTTPTPTTQTPTTPTPTTPTPTTPTPTTPTPTTLDAIKLLVETAQAVIAPAPAASAPTTPTPNAPAPTTPTPTTPTPTTPTPTTPTPTCPTPTTLDAIKLLLKHHINQSDVNLSLTQQTCSSLEKIIVPYSIGGLTKENFLQLTTDGKIGFFKRLCNLDLKELVLDKFCDGIQNCFYLIASGTTDTQRLKLLSNNPTDRELYYGEICGKKCEHLQKNIESLTDDIVTQVNSKTTRRRKNKKKKGNYVVSKVKEDKKFMGGTTEDYNTAGEALTALVKFGIDGDKAGSDPKKMLVSLVDLVAAIGPLMGPKGAALAMLAGPLKMLLGAGGELTGDELMKNLMKDLTNKVEEEHKKTRQFIENKIDAQTKEMQAGFTSLENSITDSTALIGRQIEAQTKLLIKEISESKKELKTIIENAIIVFSSSTREQTNQILSEVQLQNRDKIRMLSMLYSKADQDLQSFYEAVDELKGLRDKFVLMEVFLSKNEDDHVYEDLSTIMNQFNTFEGAKQLGTTRSWMSRFCDNWENSYLCLDLLELYVTLALLRDKIFMTLAATIKNSDHCDADMLADQILETTIFKQKRDGDFLAQMVMNTESGTAVCLISCITQHLSQPSKKTTFEYPGTVLEGTRTFYNSHGSLICKFLSSVSNYNCNPHAMLLSECQECQSKMECKDGFYAGFELSGHPSLIWKRKCMNCGCNLVGTIQGKESCDDNGQCFCNSFYNGRKCDNCKKENTADCNTGECKDGFYQSPTKGCVPCRCVLINSYNAGVCDKTTGQCSCYPGYQDRQCDQCQSGYYTFLLFGLTKRCYKCTCPGNLALPGNKCTLSGSCKCKAHAVGRYCTECATGYYQTVDNACVDCTCGLGAVDNECTDAVVGNAGGKCDCKNNYLATDQKCTQCNPVNSFLDAQGECSFCPCHTEGTTNGETNCNVNGACYCTGDYFGIPANKACRFMKGYSKIRIRFGHNGGSSDYKLQLKNFDGKTCTTGNLNMNYVHRWHDYGYSGDCKSSDWVLRCNYIQVYTVEVDFWDGVIVSGLEVWFGNTKFTYYDNGLEWGGGFPFGSAKTWRYTFYCKENCNGLPSCSQKRQKTHNISPWSYPGPYEKIQFAPNGNQNAVEKYENDRTSKDEI